MHELTLAGEVIKIAEDEAKKNHALSVTEITIEVGSLSGIEVEAFEFALSILKEDSLLEKAHLNIVRINGTGICSDCGREFEMSRRMDRCPACNSYPSEIRGGTEFRVVSIIIEED